jgi:hypothetical protein
MSITLHTIREQHKVLVNCTLGSNAHWGPTPKCGKLHSALLGQTHFGVKIEK